MTDSIMSAPEKHTGPTLTTTVRVTEWTLNHLVDNQDGDALTACGRLVRIESAAWVTDNLVTFRYCLPGNPQEYQGEMATGQEIELPAGLFVPSAGATMGKGE